MVNRAAHVRAVSPDERKPRVLTLAEAIAGGDYLQIICMGQRRFQRNDANIQVFYTVEHCLCAQGQINAHRRSDRDQS